MFLGEVGGFAFFFYEKSRLMKKYGNYDSIPEVIEAKQKGLKMKFNPLICAIPMMCDLTASVLLMIGYINIAASIAQMIGSLIVFVTAIEAILFLNKTLFRHNWVGAFSVVLGIGLVALSALRTQNEVETGNAVIGVTMMVGSAFMQGTQFAIEEKIMSTYYMNPFQFAGWEGIWGLLFLLFALPILQFIPGDSALGNDDYVENSIFAIQQTFSSPRLIFLLIFSMIVIGLYNGLGLAVTKLVSASNRVVLRQLKIVLIWFFFLVYPYEGKESFKPLQLLGFVILVFGVFLYNEVIVIHHGGLADNLVIKKEEQDNPEYIEFKRSDSNKI